MQVQTLNCGIIITQFDAYNIQSWSLKPYFSLLVEENLICRIFLRQSDAYSIQSIYLKSYFKLIAEDNLMYSSYGNMVPIVFNPDI